VQRGQHQVAGERGLDGDLRGLEVADLADHDHVRVLPQDGAQGLGEVELDLRVDLRLADAGQLVLDRVFHRHDVAAARVQPASAAYSVVVLPEPVGPVTRMMPCGCAISCSKPVQRVAGHAHRFEAELALALVQQAQHGAFAVRAGQRGHAHVDRAGADAQRDAAVLRQALLGDVQVGHDLQARDQRRVQRAVGLHHFAQRAVDAEAHGRMRS
jgi:hypothetical protein